jgi:alpha-glucosidase
MGYLALKLDSDEPAVDFGEFDAGVVDFTNPEAAEWFSVKKLSATNARFLDSTAGWPISANIWPSIATYNGDPMGGA